MKSKTKKQSPDLGERLSMTEWKKHYVSTVTAEDDLFPQRESGTNLGRIFVLLLLLHVFIIGAVVLYNIVAPKAPLASRTDGKPQTLNKPVAKTETTSTAARAVTAAPTAKPAEQPAAQKPAPAVAKIDPPATPKPAPKPVENLLTYEVKSGDNVPGIASALGVNPEDLVKLNNLDNSELYPGRKLVYRNPAASDTASEAPAAPAPPKLQPVSLNTVTAAPKPKTEQLKLVVPPKERTEDGPPKVAVKVNVPDASPDEVPHAVPVKSMSNVEDQPPPAKPKVKSNIEDAPPAKPKSESKPKTEEKKKSKSEKSESKTASKSDKDKGESKKSDKASGKKTHIVGAHETLYSISRKFGVSVSALQKANDIKDPTRLRDGSKLVIPSKN